MKSEQYEPRVPNFAIEIFFYVPYPFHSMFAVVYQGYLKPGREATYRAAWKKVASFFIEKRGAIGSCLHQAPDGMMLAYSRWPDRKTRDASWGDGAKTQEMPREIFDAIATIKECLDPARPIPEICLEVIEDLL